jgi:N-acetylglucosamine-6-sulfatase
VVTVAPAWLTGATKAGAASPGRPNLILIRTDDQTAHQFNSRTMPNTIRLLARRGTTFTNSIVTTPLCCPSRASSLTGQYGHNNGVLSNDPGYPDLIEKQNTLPVWLRRAGYRTAHVGKYFNNYSVSAPRPGAVAPGWDEWRTAFDREGPRYYGYSLSDNGQRVTYGEQASDYVTRVLNREAVGLIRAYASGDRPLFLQLDQRAPHRSVGVARGRCRNHLPQPDPRDVHRFAHEPLRKPPSFNEMDVSDKPSFIRGLRRLGPSSIRRMKVWDQCARASLREVDRGVASIHRALQRTGEWGNTVIVFTSDNGYYYGEHRLGTGKAPPYEESIRVPLVIRAPSAYRNGAPRVSRIAEPVGNIDLTPTILRLAGARPCGSPGHCRTMDGRSLMPFLAGNTRAWPAHRGLLVELDQSRGGNAGVCAYAGIRVQARIFTEYTQVVDRSTGACKPARERELYDLGNDPYELRNLAGRRGHAAERRRLSARLERLRRCAGIAGRDRRLGGRPFCE